MVTGWPREGITGEIRTPMIKEITSKTTQVERSGPNKTEILSELRGHREKAMVEAQRVGGYQNLARYSVGYEVTY